MRMGEETTKKSNREKERLKKEEGAERIGKTGKENYLLPPATCVQGGGGGWIPVFQISLNDSSPC